MIKLKELIKESKYAFDRKFGDPLPTFKGVMKKHQINEGIDLYSHVKLVQRHLNIFKSNIEAERGGSFDSDSVEYEKDRLENDSKMLKGRDKKLGQWEKKVNKTLMDLLKVYKKAWI